MNELMKELKKLKKAKDRQFKEDSIKLFETLKEEAALSGETVFYTEMENQLKHFRNKNN